MKKNFNNITLSELLDFYPEQRKYIISRLSYTEKERLKTECESYHALMSAHNCKFSELKKIEIIYLLINKAS